MRSFWRTTSGRTRSAPLLDRDLARNIGLVCLADAIVGASFGAIAVSGGMRPWVPVTMSLLVFAGSAQFAAVGVVLAGGTPAAAVVAGLLLNTRLLPYGFTAAEVVKGRWWTRLAGAHVVTDESVAFLLAQGEHGQERRRRAAFWASGLALFLFWNAAVALGALAGTAMHDPGAFGLDAAFPAVLLALVVPSLATDRAIRRASLLGAVIALAASSFLPAGLPVLLALGGLVLARDHGGPTVPDATTPDATGRPDPVPEAR